MARFSNAIARQVVDALMRYRWSRTIVGVLVLLAVAGGGLGVVLQAASSDTQALPAGIAYTLTGKVVNVADGDTFTLLADGRQQRVRLASIDAPEQSKDAKRRGQPMASASRKALAVLLAGKTVTAQCYEKDRYSRHICNVPLEDGRIVNRVMVQDGLAWANMEGRGKFMRDPALHALERDARQARKGLWAVGNPVAPWAWRYQCWTQHQCQGAG
ncbi:MAG: thermonuclease family protein [Candidimonas sp.]